MKRKPMPHMASVGLGPAVMNESSNVDKVFGLQDDSGVRRWKTMQVYIGLQPIASLIAGILILMIPRLLNYIVAIYLIVIGILGLVKL